MSEYPEGWNYERVAKVVAHYERQADSEALAEDEEGRRFIVRLWDGMDGEWMDVSESVPLAEATRIWNEKTDNGAKCASYHDIDYYRIFPATTKMLWSEGRSQNR